MLGRSSSTPSPPWWERTGSIWLSFRGRAEERFVKRQSERKQRPRGPHHLIAGTSAGVVTTAALFPLDLVKTRYQVYDKGPSPYKSVWMALRAIIREEGAGALYQGLTPALLASAVSWGGFFYCYEGIKRATQDKLSKNDLGPLHHLGAGFAAGAIMVFATNPVWMIKTRMQLQDSTARGNAMRPYSGFFDALGTILREEGPLAFYKGAVPALLLCSQGAVQFAVYEWLKARVPKDNENTPLESLVMGGFSKIIASLVTYPSQVIKSRLQQRGTEEEIKARVFRYRGLVHCAVMIARKEGLRGFFKGCVPYALRAAPASAVTFVVYEETIKLLNTQP